MPWLTAQQIKATARAPSPETEDSVDALQRHAVLTKSTLYSVLRQALEL